MRGGRHAERVRRTTGSGISSVERGEQRPVIVIEGAATIEQLRGAS